MSNVTDDIVVSPLIIEIMLFHSYSPAGERVANASRPAQKRAMMKLEAMGLLKASSDGNYYVITQRGRLYVRRLLKVRLMGEPAEMEAQHA